MPNWKSYDSSVRLLSAILAAHPELRLNYQEIAKCFGGDVTGSGLEWRFRRIRADAKAIKEARAKGIDPLTLALDGGSSKPVEYIQKRYGGDCTVSALENRFRRIKSDARALNDALAAGIDPMTISTDSLNGRVGKEIAKYYGDCTASSLDHRFRPIKKEAQAMRAGIADKYGEGTTAKAVSTRFERLKKEPGWLTNGNTGASGSPTGNGAPVARKPATPRKKKVVGGEQYAENSDDDEAFEELKSTSKKSTLNKVQAGRVSKPTTPRKNLLMATQNNPISIDDDEDDHFETMKIEQIDRSTYQSYYNNGNHMQVDDDNGGADFYNADNGYGSDADAV